MKDIKNKKAIKKKKSENKPRKSFGDAAVPCLPANVAPRPATNHNIGRETIINLIDAVQKLLIGAKEETDSIPNPEARKMLNARIARESNEPVQSQEDGKKREVDQQPGPNESRRRSSSSQQPPQQRRKRKQSQQQSNRPAPDADHYTVPELLKEMQEYRRLIQRLCEAEPTVTQHIQSIINDFPHIRHPEGITSHLAKEKPKEDAPKGRGRTKINKIVRVKDLEEKLRTYINGIIMPSDKWRIVEEKNLKFVGGFKQLENYASTLEHYNFGRIVENTIRVNRKNNKQAFLTMSADPESSERDAMMPIHEARQFALEGDLVRAFVFHPDESPGSKSKNEQCPKAVVLRILESERSEHVGYMRFRSVYTLSDSDKKAYYRIVPDDKRIPFIYVSGEHWNTYDAAQSVVCSVKISHITREGYAIGKDVCILGQKGDLECEVESAIINNKLGHIKQWEGRFNEMFASPELDLKCEDLLDRTDLRGMTIFTIDPPTARDLDDAVSLDKLSDTKYRIGVHISDVSYYLQEDTEIDNIVKNRATSIYLMTSVIHMIPDTLCQRCSLLPGEDKLTYSVFWVYDTSDDTIECEQVVRSVIRSCGQLAYGHVQHMLDNEGALPDDFPRLCNDVTPEEIYTRVEKLNAIAKKLRQKRYENGTLSLNNVKLRFEIDPQSGEPLAFAPEKRLEAHLLIEEFMLLANMEVAKIIYEKLPEISVLRHHPPPMDKTLKQVQEKLRFLGYVLDISSAKSISRSMEKLVSEAKNPEAMKIFLPQLLTKPMSRARYFNTTADTKPTDMWHYALAVPFYTHFTSPIRRYPDIMVHRLLTAALDLGPRPQRSPEELHAIVKVCNDNKWCSKALSEDCEKIYFNHYLAKHGPLRMPAVVMDLTEQVVHVCTFETGHQFSINIFYDHKDVRIVNQLPIRIYLLDEELNELVPIKVLDTVIIAVEYKDFKLHAKLLAAYTGNHHNH